MNAGQPEAEGEDERARGCFAPGFLRGSGPAQDPSRGRTPGGDLFLFCIVSICNICFFEPWIRDGKKCGLINPDYFFESLETVLGFKILKFFDADPGSGSF